jgi:hypothetical protein
MSSTVTTWPARSAMRCASLRRSHRILVMTLTSPVLGGRGPGLPAGVPARRARPAVRGTIAIARGAADEGVKPWVSVLAARPATPGDDPPAVLERTEAGCAALLRCLAGQGHSRVKGNGRWWDHQLPNVASSSVRWAPEDPTNLYLLTRWSPFGAQWAYCLRMLSVSASMVALARAVGKCQLQCLRPLPEPCPVATGTRGKECDCSGGCAQSYGPAP